MLLRPRVAANHGCAMRAIAGWCLWFLALSGALSIGCAMQTHNGGALVLADGASGPMSSPAYANAFEQWNVFSTRTSSSPVTFRLQAETKFGWEVCVTGGCEALGYWDPDKALLLRTDPSRYPIWEGVGQLPGGCDIEYKYLMRPRGRCDDDVYRSCLSACPLECVHALMPRACKLSYAPHCRLLSRPLRPLLSSGLLHVVMRSCRVLRTCCWVLQGAWCLLLS